MSYKHQHFVSQGLLNKFSCKESTTKTKKIYFIRINETKATLKCTNIRNVAGARYLYNYTKNEKLSLENTFFDKIDHNISIAINQVISDTKNLEKQKHHIISYVASQITRTPETLQRIKDLDSLIKDNIDEDFSFIKDTTAQNNFLETIKDNTEKYIKILLEKECQIYENPRDFFVISDNPVIMINSSNEQELEISEKKYIPVLNCSIFMMPISPKHLIIFHNKSTPIEELNYYIEKINRIQFTRANDFVFSNNKFFLEQGLNLMHIDNYNYINLTNPQEIIKRKIRIGDEVKILKTKIVLEKNVIDIIKKNLNIDK